MIEVHLNVLIFNNVITANGTMLKITQTRKTVNYVIIK